MTLENDEQEKTEEEELLERSYKRFKKEDPKIRACLGYCGKEFKSIGKYNRMCDKCKGTIDWQAGVDTYTLEKKSKR